MNVAQNSTNTPLANSSEEKLKKQMLDDLKYEQYVSFVAVGGLLTDDDGKIKKMSLQDFANSIAVDRKTLYNWKARADFWDKVGTRRSEIFSQNRITAVWNGLFLRAAKGDAEQAKIILGEYAKWQPPSQKHDVQIGGLMDLVKVALSKNIIDGEVLNGDNSTASAGDYQGLPEQA